MSDAAVTTLAAAHPGLFARWTGQVRLVVRLSIFVVGTLAFWAAMEVDGLLRRPKSQTDLIFKWVPRWAKTMLRAFGIRVHADGPYAAEGRTYPNTDARGVGRIFIANHRSALDIPVLLSLVAAHVISRHDVADWPLIGRGGRRIGTLFVNRKSTRSGAAVLQQVAESLTAGKAIAMFPEGTAHIGDEVHDFKTGAFKAALRAGAEIVPLGIAYSDPTAYFAGQPFLKHVKRIGQLRRLDVAVQVGEPLSPGELSTLELKDRARDTVQQLVNTARARLDAPPARGAS